MKTTVNAHLIFKNEKIIVPDNLDSWFEPSKTAVVSIDMQRGFLEEQGKCPCPCARGRNIIGLVNEFHAKVRKLNVPIIHVQLTLRENGIDDTKSKKSISNWRWFYLQFYAGIGSEAGDELALEGSKWHDIMIEVDEEKDYFIKTKKRFSSFYPTDLEFLLGHLGVEIVVLNGIMTDCCVLNAAYDAASRDFKVIIPIELTKGYSDEAERGALGIMALYLGLVVNSNELLREWNARL